jgi:hypothetical protein
MRILFIMAIFLNHLALSAPDTNAPVIKVDEKHQWMNYPSDKSVQVYHVPLASSMVLDAAGYTFKIPPALQSQHLNSVQVTQSATEQFELAWQDGTTRYELSKDTLRALPGSGPFQAFRAGGKVYVAIGVVNKDKRFTPVWTTVIQVEK